MSRAKLPFKPLPPERPIHNTIADLLAAVAAGKERREDIRVVLNVRSDEFIDIDFYRRDNTRAVYPHPTSAVVADLLSVLGFWWEME